MGANLNSLIAAGGTNVASPIQRYQQTRQNMQAQQMNALTMQSTQQQMGIRQQQAEQERQAANLKIMAPLAKSVVTAQDKPAAYKYAVQQLKSQNIDTSQFPPEYSDEMMPSLTAVMQAGGLSFDEAPKTRTVFDKQEKVNQEWDAPTGTWKEVGRGIPSQQTGLPGDFKPTKGGINKVIADRTEANVATNAAINGMQELARIVSKPEWMGGVAGDAISTINSLTSQWKQLTGTNDSVINEEGQIDSSKISPASIKAGWIDKIGRRGAEYKAAVIELAYAKSRAVGNTRITDKDFEFAEKMIAKGGSRESILNNLKLQIERTAKNYNESEKIYQQRYGKQGYKANTYEIQNSPFSYDKTPQDEIKPDNEFDPDAWLKEAENQ